MIELPYNGTRAMPWDLATGSRILYHHVMRYAWALQHVWNKRVVDLGSGAGYGAYMLSWGAKEVLGVDIDPAAIEYAEERFQAHNLEYMALDITERIPQADVYVAFEVLEHLDDPAALLARLDDPLVWSIPIDNPNPPHKRAYSRAEIEALMAGSAIWYQLADGLIVRSIPSGAAAEYVLGVLKP